MGYCNMSQRMDELQLSIARLDKDDHAAQIQLEKLHTRIEDALSRLPPTTMQNQAKNLAKEAKEFKARVEEFSERSNLMPTYADCEANTASLGVNRGQRLRQALLAQIQEVECIHNMVSPREV